MTATLLNVSYESQLDNRSGTGWRECYSSSAAMLARYWGKVGSDEEYNRIRARFGDTTLAHSQLEALRSLGLKSHLWTNGSRVDLEREILAGRPVAVGWFHKGSVRKPAGGHWSVVVGIDGQFFYMHDPYGEPLLLSGGHLPRSSGRSVRCSWANFLPRWMIEGPRSGWYLTCSL